MKNPKNLLIQDFQQVGNIGLPINNQPVYIPTSAFPNTNLLYGWRNGQPVQGGIALTKNGTINQAVDHSGATSECEFAGAGYYSSADAAFAFTGSFSIGFWMYRKDWAATRSATQCLIGRYTGSTGWVLQQLTGTNTLELWQNNSTINQIQVGHLSSGFHFFSIVRDVTNVQTRISIDSIRVATAQTVGSITASNELEICSANSGINKVFDARVSDIWIHNGTAWTDAQVKAIYAASCPQASYNQRLAGHRLQTVEPNQTASEVLAHYKFGADLTLDEKGSYPLTAVGTPTQAEDIFGNMGALRTSNGNCFQNANLLATAPSKGIWISCWVRPEFYDNVQQVIFNKTLTAGTAEFGLQKYLDGRYMAWAYNGAKQTIIYSLSTTRCGRWEKFDFCWDSINGVRLFVNGVLEASDVSNTVIPVLGNTYPFNIGRYNNNASTTYYFTGSICDFKVMDKVPTQKDIDIAYASTFAKPDGFKGADIVVRPSGDSSRERREKIQCYVDNGTVYRQGMRQLYYDLSDKSLKSRTLTASVSSTGVIISGTELLKKCEYSVTSCNCYYQDGLFSVLPVVQSQNNSAITWGGTSIQNQTLSSFNNVVWGGSGYGSEQPFNVEVIKQGPDYLPEGFVACNSHDLIQIRGEK